MCTVNMLELKILNRILIRKSILRASTSYDYKYCISNFLFFKLCMIITVSNPY